MLHLKNRVCYVFYFLAYLILGLVCPPLAGESQNYMTKRVASIGYIIYVARGFYSNIINLENTQ